MDVHTETLVSDIYDRIALDPDVDSAIEVERHDPDTIKLSGVVKSEREKMRVQAIAESIFTGKIMNDISVEFPTQTSAGHESANKEAEGVRRGAEIYPKKEPEKADSTLERQILDRVASSHVNIVDMSISVIDGEAVLSGEVDRVEQIEAAGTAASEVEGVVLVKNDLVVSSRK